MSIQNDTSDVAVYFISYQLHKKREIAVFSNNDGVNSLWHVVINNEEWDSFIFIWNVP